MNISNKAIVRGIILMFFAILLFMQGTALFISAMCMLKYAKAIDVVCKLFEVSILLLLAAYLQQLSLAHPEFQYASEVKDYYKDFSESKSKAYAEVIFISMGMFVWLTSLTLGDVLFPGTKAYMVDLFDSNYNTLTGLYAMPSMITIKGLVAAFTVSNEDAPYMEAYLLQLPLAVSLLLPTIATAFLRYVRLLTVKRNKLIRKLESK